jgi:YVTN family beta-propeller protein
MNTSLRVLPALLLLSTGCGTVSVDPPDGIEDSVAQTLFVARSGALVSFDLASGTERPGTVQDVTGPTGLTALEDGTLLVNLQGRNEVLAVDGRTMLERARQPSSARGATRPVHGYLSPVYSGRRLWMALNDGNGTRATNSARFFDATLGSATLLQPLGEVELGVGHHKAAFSGTRPRVVISNMADCDEVLAIYDLTDAANPQRVRGFSAAELEPSRTCSAAAPLAPHGCAAASGRAYCNLTGTGGIASVALDADAPTFRVLATAGKGSGYTLASADGRWVYSAQNSPREGAGGATGQLGQLVVIDAAQDRVVAQLPLMYRNADEVQPLAGTDEARADPGHLVLSRDGRTLYVTPAGPFGDANARVRRELVVDVSTPGAPVQRASLVVGASTGHHGDALTPDGRLLFVTNNVDGSLSEIDTASGTVLRQLPVGAAPQEVVTWGSGEGSSSLGDR